MNESRADSTTRLGQIRRPFWALLLASLLVALLLPAGMLWHAASSPLVLRACVWPLVPQAGVPAQLRVVMPAAADRAAVHGPWAQVSAEWDMVTMKMGARRASLSGPETTSVPHDFVIPLHVDMAGLWQASVRLSTPGRPTAQVSVEFVVAPTGSSTQTESATRGEASPSTGCASPGASISSPPSPGDF